MSGARCARKRLWRWRANPLRRPVDVVEGWVLLVAWLVATVGGVLAGLVTTGFADDVFAEQRAERLPLRAVLLTGTPQRTTAADSDGRTVAKVRWTASDGTVRTGDTLVPGGLSSGTTVTVWQDTRGALVPEPTRGAEAAVEAAVFGVAAGLGFSGVAVAAAFAGRGGLDRHRIALWHREWESVGPRWTQRTG
ncbi:hypothetical protein [Streptomyces sp. CRN 30]|uniref:Rv1733c family protein n=1 Tax=Streptomyces sp. CRN 30 TaxID=3075613 RepID=UPI002A83A441|nr:hypothetical protein [Streptomyces sp. CRN 30]